MYYDIFLIFCNFDRENIAKLSYSRRTTRILKRYSKSSEASGMSW